MDTQPDDTMVIVFRLLPRTDLLTCRLVCWGFRSLINTEPYAWDLLPSISYDLLLSYQQWTFLFIDPVIPTLKHIMIRNKYEGLT
jgi:hypothetical protein